MTISLLFWILMLLVLVFGIWFSVPAAPNTPWNFKFLGNNVIIFVLLALLGWHVFGPAVTDNNRPPAQPYNQRQ
jgi:hypothetical protein